ncbi:beta-lactamase/transpeptidase-like protein [Cladorrhinum sp. PSN332]|nr:beta-lactamase/transpeptidase-like protein [Cladorrhinum sp. PSN332]
MSIFCWPHVRAGQAKSSNKTRNQLLHALHDKEARIRQIRKITGVVGLSAAVIDHGETIFQVNAGYRNLAKKEPVTSDTIFPIASLTKSFTGVCLDRLRDDNKLSFDDLIVTHLAEARSRDPVVAENATIADLLGHRTGLQKADSIWLGANGELMLTNEQTVALFAHLLPQASLRSRFIYSNFGYAVLGEIITQASGQPYHLYLQEKVLGPLKMSRTVTTKENGLPDDHTLAYSVLDNGEPYNVPLPASIASGPMGSAGGLSSTVNDLAKYYKALMRAWRIQKQGGLARNKEAAGDLLSRNDITWLFTPLQIMETPTFREKSYASGWGRSQLPAAVGTFGVNPSMVDEMPLLADGLPKGSRLALWHQGSLVGATAFVMLLPETESAVVVLTNTMAHNDAADWIGQLLAETLLAEGPTSSNNDYVLLAEASKRRALEMYAELTRKIDEGRTTGGPPRPLRDFVGRYVGFGGVYEIKIVETDDGGLDMLLQGRESQRYRLLHHHEHTFTWFMTFNEQIKKARFISYLPDPFFITFKAEPGPMITAIKWVHDVAGRPEGEILIRQL